MPIAQAAARAAQAFAPGSVLSVDPLGRGLINDTFLVSAEAGQRFVLQRINSRVFPDPIAVMANLRTLSDHVGRLPPHPAGFRLPAIVPTHTGRDFHRDAEGDLWRALTYIEGARNLEALDSGTRAEQVGLALGRFHALGAALAPESLRDTLPDFHIAPAYLARFDAILARHSASTDGAELQDALAFIEARRDIVGLLEAAKERGALRLRVIHGDPKLDNILFDDTTGQAVSLIDLDTVKSGLIHYDIGDCLRSCCNRARKTSGPTSFDLELCRAILRGYLAAAGEFLTPDDKAHLYHAIRLLPFELGLRFLTDHLEGDVYFKVAVPGQNLRRAWMQFQLAASVERQEAAIVAMLKQLL